MKRQNLGEILLNMGAIDELQLQSALAHQRQWGTPLGQSLVRSRMCSEAQVLEALAKQAALPQIDLDAMPLDLALTPLVSQKVAEQHRVVPIGLEGKRQEVLVVAIAAPASIAALDAVRSVSNKQRVVPRLASDAAIERAIGKLYRGYATAETVPVAARGEAMRFDETEFVAEREDHSYAFREAERSVLIFGWTEDAGDTLAAVLSTEGIDARVVGPMEVLRCREDDVVVAPLPAVEAVLPVGQRFHARLVVVGRQPDDELPRAQAIGALGFVAAPLDAALLVRAVRRCRQLAGRPHATA